MRGGGGRQPYVAPDGADAASIPASSRKMVRSLKGILADRSEGEIYAMLCDCSMDPRHRRREAHLPRHGGFLGCDAESSGNSIRLLPSRDYEGQMTLFDDDAEETEEPEVKIAEAAVKEEEKGGTLVGGFGELQQPVGWCSAGLEMALAREVLPCCCL